jgi:YD repeat-containing protein
MYPLAVETIMTRRFRILVVAAIVLVSSAGVTMLARRSTAQVAPPPPVVVQYSYDSLGRVVQEVYPANSIGYGYDAAGNRTSFTLH